MTLQRLEVPFGDQPLIIETGKLAKQASGAVTVTCGGTVVLVTACMAKSAREGMDFFPLMVEYQEKMYSAGRIPGGFFKREGRPSEKEILTSRMIDRPLRPLFPEGLYNDVQVVATVLSHDGVNDADVLAIVGASTALTISDIPFNGPIGACRVAMIDGEFVANPSYEEREEETLDFIVVGREDGIVMIEGEGVEIPEDRLVEAFKFGLEQLQATIKVQYELQKLAGKPKADVALRLNNPELVKKVRSLCEAPLAAAYKIVDKQEREDAVNAVYQDIISDMSQFDDFKPEGGREVSKGDIFKIFDEVQYGEIRKLAFEKGLRTDGRGVSDLRELKSEVNVLPRTHGTGLFTRGQTQSMAIITLGSKVDEQLNEGLEGVSYKNFLLHYNFPSFSVGEAKPMRGPGRREIGHGALARKSLVGVLPTKEEFPYTIRVVSEILESNGSSSMATVCASTLALLAAGVPMKAPVAGISIGLMTAENEKDSLLLTDIMGSEDHFGDMDFKVAGTRKGVTGIQLDLKVLKVSVDLLARALKQAKDARMAILDNMTATISEPAELSQYAPRVHSMKIPVDKIGEIIGPGGKMIRKIMETTGATSIDLNDDGTVFIGAPGPDELAKAVEFISNMIMEPEIGKIYDATVKKIMDFGAFCEILPGKEGLVHISEFSSEYVKDIHSVVKEGDKFKVKLLEIDKMKRLNLSKKQAEAEAKAESEANAG